MLILAHRGLPGIDRPENSLAAVAAAYLCGADGVEVDLRLTADGVLALSHDPDLGRLTGSSLGIADAPWAALFEHAARRRVRLARAEEVLDLARGRRIVLEVKKPPPGRASDALIALAVGELVQSMPPAGAVPIVTISSFSPGIVRTVRTLLPRGGGIRTALLGSRKISASTLLQQAVEDDHDEMHPHISSLTTDGWVVAAARACGVAVVPWTVNEHQDIRRLAVLGVDGFITDVPAEARATLTPATVSADPWSSREGHLAVAPPTSAPVALRS